MIAMNDVPRHFNSTDITDRAVAPVFQVLAPSCAGYRALFAAKIIADIEAAHGAPFAPREGPTDFRRFDDVNSRMDCLAHQGRVYDV
jgi:hypothetical protein